MKESQNKGNLNIKAEKIEHDVISESSFNISRIQSKRQPSSDSDNSDRRFNGGGNGIVVKQFTERS